MNARQCFPCTACCEGWLLKYAEKIRMPLIFQINLMKDGQYIGVKTMGAGPPQFVEAVRNAISPQDVFRI